MRLVVVLLSVLAALSVSAYADPASDDALLQVKVAEPFVEVHTGPGRGYPVFHVVERDASLTLLFQRAGWIKVETLRGRVGWVPRRALTATLDGKGQPPVMTRLGHEAFLSGHWQASGLVLLYLISPGAVLHAMRAASMHRVPLPPMGSSQTLPPSSPFHLLARTMAAPKVSRRAALWIVSPL